MDVIKRTAVTKGGHRLISKWETFADILSRGRLLMKECLVETNKDLYKLGG